MVNMELGRLSVLIALAASCATVVAYFAALRRPRALVWARAAFGVASLSTAAAFFRLMWLCANHRFEFQYVFDYTSTDLGAPFVYAATWAGQEGSFLLWALCTALLGGFVVWKAGAWEARVMPFYTSTLALLAGILTWLSPFAPTPLAPGMAGPPVDGAGLNPSLQNYWMAIHPPTIFLGFVALSIAFSYAVAAMIWRDYGTREDPRDAAWVARVMPWTLLAVATLGAGLFMGGYWAYETQGWHGFWAWDPVENASLFPWLASIALAHGLIVQRSRGGMARTNLLLAVLAWNLFLYGTYLTRSGVLSDVSVHAFGMLANKALYLLLVLIGLHAGLGIVLLLLRWRDAPSRPISDNLLSLDTAMVMAVALLSAGAVIITVGTSWSLIVRSSALHLLATSAAALWVSRAVLLVWAALTIRSIRRSSGEWWLVGSVTVGLLAVYVGWFGLPLLAAQASSTGTPWQAPLYNRVGTCLILPALIAMGAAPFLSWGKSDPDRFLWRLLAPWFLAVACGFGIAWYVQKQAAAGFEAATPRLVVVATGTLGLFAAFASILWLGRVLKPAAKGRSLIGAGIGALAGGLVAFWGALVVMGGALGAEASANAVIGVTLLLIAVGGAFTALGARILRVVGITAGGWLAHAGVGLFLLGAVISNVYEQTASVDLIEGQPAAETPFGYAVEFDGWTHDGKPSDVAAREWFEFSHGAKLRLRRTGTSGSGRLAILPVFYSTQRMNSGETEGPVTMRWPNIVREPARDFYVVVANDPKPLRVGTTVCPGQTQIVATPMMTTTGYSVRYKRFYTNGKAGEMGTELGADMDLIAPDGRAYPFRATMSLSPETGGLKPVPAQIEGLGGEAILAGSIDVSTKELTVLFDLPDQPARWRIPLSFTNKPLINLVWLGVVLMTVGTVIAMVRRAREARIGTVEAASAPAAPTPKAAGRRRRRRPARV